MNVRARLNPRPTLFLLAALLLLPGFLQATDRIDAAEARHHIGEEATVCGKVASTRYAPGSRGQPTFLNLEKPYPNQLFTAVIWVENRGKFPKPPESLYRDESICITGELSSYRGIPQIEVEEPDQIEIVKKTEVRADVRPPPPPPRNCTPRAECCKVCSKGKACGNTCISRSYNCRKGRGCACNSWEICR